MSRAIVAVHLDRVLRIAAPLSLVLLIGNLSLTAANWVVWRGGSPILWVAAIATVLTVGVLVTANLWTKNMARALRGAGAVHDPLQVYQFGPKEQMLWRNVTIPQLAHQVAIGKALKIPGTDELEAKLQDFIRWEALGYIPREEFPKELQKFYIWEGSKL